MIIRWYVERAGMLLAQRGETFETTEDLAGAIGIDPTHDLAIEMMFIAAHAYHDAGGRFGDVDDEMHFTTDEQLLDLVENGSFEESNAAHDELDRRYGDQ